MICFPYPNAYNSPGWLAGWQFSMCMFYLVEEDTSYANTARDWALFYARRDDWLANDLVPMDITSGMALTYDILYDYLTAAERGELPPHLVEGPGELGALLPGLDGLGGKFSPVRNKCQRPGKVFPWIGV